MPARWRRRSTSTGSFDEGLVGAAAGRDEAATGRVAADGIAGFCEATMGLARGALAGFCEAAAGLAGEALAGFCEAALGRAGEAHTGF